MNYDILGISWYPGWHGNSFSALLNGLNNFARLYGKPIMIAETAYQFTAANYDQVPNWFDASSLVTGYPATEQGQYDFLVQLLDVVENIDQNKGIGICYWGAEWIAYGGSSETDWEHGSRMDNAALFRSDNHYALHAFDAFNSNGLNLARNPGFEADSTAQPSTAWLRSAPNVEASYSDSGGYSGRFKRTHRKAAAYAVYTYQTITGLANGNYTLKAWVRSSGGQTANRMEAKNYGGAMLSRDIPATGTWTQISLSNIPVSNGQCTIGFYTNAPGNKWLDFDNVLFYKQ